MKQRPRVLLLSVLVTLGLALGISSVTRSQGPPAAIKVPCLEIAGNGFEPCASVVPRVTSGAETRIKEIIANHYQTSGRPNWPPYLSIFNSTTSDFVACSVEAFPENNSIQETATNHKGDSCGGPDAELRMTFRTGPYVTGAGNPTDLGLGTEGNALASGKFEFTGIETINGVPQPPATLQVDYDQIFDLSVNFVNKWKQLEAFLKGETLRRFYIEWKNVCNEIKTSNTIDVTLASGITDPTLQTIATDIETYFTKYATDLGKIPATTPEQLALACQATGNKPQIVACYLDAIRKELEASIQYLAVLKALKEANTWAEKNIQDPTSPLIAQVATNLESNCRTQCFTQKNCAADSSLCDVQLPALKNALQSCVNSCVNSNLVNELRNVFSPTQPAACTASVQLDHQEVKHA